MTTRTPIKFQRLILMGISVSLGMLITSTVANAHKPITSKYTYNEHIYPIVKSSCGSCHRNGGLGPMSLLTYEEAYPWAQAIKEEVVSLTMPPWKSEEGFGDLRTPHALTPREIDILVEWCNGGTPEGKTSISTKSPNSKSNFDMDEPDLIVGMPSNYTLNENTSEATRFFVLSLDLKRERWIQAIDIRPGNSSIVRTVTLFADNSGKAKLLDSKDPGLGFSSADDTDLALETILALWLPGQQPMQLSDRAAYHLPAGSDLVLRIQYKKNWTNEGSKMTDQTSVGMYFLENQPAEQVQIIVLSSPQVQSVGGTIKFKHQIEQDIDVLSFLPRLSATVAQLQVEVTIPNESKETILLLSQPTPDWASQYWLESPLSLPQGSWIEVSITPAYSNAKSTTTDETGTMTTPPQLRLDYVAHQRTAYLNTTVH